MTTSATQPGILTSIKDRTGREIREGDVVVLGDPADPNQVRATVRFGRWSRTYHECSCRSVELAYVGFCLDGLWDCDDEFFAGKFIVVGSVYEAESR